MRAGIAVSLTASQIKKIAGARKTAMPEFVAPQLATLVREPPPGDEWLHELKFDGYRMLCRIDREGHFLESQRERLDSKTP